MSEEKTSPAKSDPAKRFASFAEFYPYYLGEHSDPVCRRLHFIGTSLAFLCLLGFLFTGRLSLILLGIVIGYAFAWVGHYFFEKNRPATFTYPLWSFMGDWVMWSEMLRGKVSFR